MENEKLKNRNYLRFFFSFELWEALSIFTFFYVMQTVLVIWILDRVHGLIFPVKVYILPSRHARENIHFDREYESIYLVNNPYNEYVLLQSD
jgi:hypothetical protein